MILRWKNQERIIKAFKGEKGLSLAGIVQSVKMVYSNSREAGGSIIQNLNLFKDTQFRQKKEALLCGLPGS